MSGHGSPLMKTHGCLMVLAWVLCASIGVILARYYKDMWPNSGLLGQHVWFQTHRILQASCVILTCVAIILAFIYCEGYSKASVSPYYVHPILGLIVFCLALINVGCFLLCQTWECQIFSHSIVVNHLLPSTVYANSDLLCWILYFCVSLLAFCFVGLILLNLYFLWSSYVSGSSSAILFWRDWIKAFGCRQLDVVDEISHWW